ncbi:hypothetical protein ACPB8Q_04400 [Methanocaldococcus indicus]|uniref:hypothetical protein n=1 Tax=Methanocaldococcus indicus TaxID=213231 RepID=UPI003C6D1FA6
MKVDDILELIDDSYKDEDIKYKCFVYFVSYFFLGIVFLILFILLKFEYKLLIFLEPIIILICGLIIIRHKELFKRTKCYFEKVLESIIFYGLIAVTLLFIIASFISLKLLPIIISIFFGFFLCIDGILFNSKKRKLLGLFLMFLSIPIYIFNSYNYLILSFGFFAVSISFLIVKL